jgi:type III secretion system chaperone SycN
MPFERAGLRAIEAFAGQFGLAARAARDGSFTFVFAASGTLTLTPSQDGDRAIVSLARHPGRVDSALMRRALSQVGVDPTTNRLVHAGLGADDSILFSIGLEQAELSIPVLDECFQQLAALHSAIR